MEKKSCGTWCLTFDLVPPYLISSNKVIVIKRTLASGYAGVDNPVFFNPNTVMLFGDAKKVCEDLLTNVKKQFGEK